MGVEVLGFDHGEGGIKVETKPNSLTKERR